MTTIRNRLNVLVLLIALLGMSLSGGCMRTIFKGSAVDEFPKAEDELAFIERVETLQAVTNNDALHGFLLACEREDEFGSYMERVAEGVRRGWLPHDFNAPANESARVGWMMNAACIEGKVKGGLTMRLLGSSPRYATKELVFMRVIPMRTENQSLSGLEFIDFLNRLNRVSELGNQSGSAVPAASINPATPPVPPG
ncbi:MAG: hypothetical protein EXS00_01470 [Phycisphaerales bacterium]|nr:hypothetical protein [Phycisphaerales bacterium]